MSEKEWVVSYHFAGTQYGLTIMAQDEIEASARLRAIGMTGTVDGELVMRVPAYPGVGVVLRVITFFRNLFFGGRNV